MQNINMWYSGSSILLCTTVRGRGGGGKSDAISDRSLNGSVRILGSTSFLHSSV